MSGAKYDYTCNTCEVVYQRRRHDEKRRDVQNECTTCAKERRYQEKKAAATGPKKCSRCKVLKPRDTEHFPAHPKKVDGLDSWCKACRAMYRSETRRGKYRHMISDEELKVKLAGYKGCEICGDPSEPVVDHCHETETYRGLLCQSCNMGLGKFYDKPERLQKAIEYLQR